MKRSVFFSFFLVLLLLFANSVVAAEQKRTLIVKNKNVNEVRFAYWYAVDPEDVNKIGELAGYHVKGWVRVPSGRSAIVDIPKTSYHDLSVAVVLSNGTELVAGGKAVGSAYYRVHPEKNFKIVQAFGSGEIRYASHGIGEADTKQIKFYRYKVPDTLELPIPGDVPIDFDGDYDMRGFSRQETGTDYALLFATDTYAHWSDLIAPIADAEAIGEKLEDRYGFKVDIRRDVTITEILNALAEYKQKSYRPGDQLLIYFAGHGHFDDVLDDGHIAGTESKRPDADERLGTYLSFNKLKADLDIFPCDRIMLMLDVCYGGTFDRDIALGASDKKRSRTRGFQQGKVAEQLKPMDPKKILALKTRWYVSSGGNEEVPDGFDHSPFASALLTLLENRDDQDGVLTLHEFERRLPSNLKDELDQLKELYSGITDPTPSFGSFGSSKEEDKVFLFIESK